MNYWKKISVLSISPNIKKSCPYVLCCNHSESPMSLSFPLHCSSIESHFFPASWFHNTFVHSFHYIPAFLLTVPRFLRMKTLQTLLMLFVAEFFRSATMILIFVPCSLSISGLQIFISLFISLLIKPSRLMRNVSCFWFFCLVLFSLPAVKIAFRSRLSAFDLAKVQSGEDSWHNIQRWCWTICWFSWYNCDSEFGWKANHKNVCQADGCIKISAPSQWPLTPYI